MSSLYKHLCDSPALWQLRNAYIPYFSFWVWVTSFKGMSFSRSPLFSVKFMILFFFNTGITFHCVYVSLTVHPFSVDVHLVFVQTLAILNIATMNMVEQVSPWWDELSFGHIPRVLELDFEGRSIPRILSYWHKDIQSGCTSLHFHQWWSNIPLAPHPSQQAVVYSTNLYHSDRRKMNFQSSLIYPDYNEKKGRKGESF